MMKKILYHIVPKLEWEKNADQSHYAPDSLQTEGFIHASTACQLSGTLRRFFSGKASEVMILHLDAEKVQAEIKYEDLYEHGALFPHIYGPLNRDAVFETSEALDWIEE